jgi:hypothetical protein
MPPPSGLGCVSPLLSRVSRNPNTHVNQPPHTDHVDPFHARHCLYGSNCVLYTKLLCDRRLGLREDAVDASAWLTLVGSGIVAIAWLADVLTTDPMTASHPSSGSPVLAQRKGGEPPPAAISTLHRKPQTPAPQTPEPHTSEPSAEERRSNPFVAIDSRNIMPDGTRRSMFSDGELRGNVFVIRGIRSGRRKQ